MKFSVISTAALVSSASSSSFDWNFGTISLWHSENTYCEPSTYLTRPYKGALEGFVPTYAISDPPHDTHGVIGYTPSQKTIYVSFRGSESIQNWLDNLDVKTTTYPLCNGCEVHEGFYKAQQSCFKDVLAEVKSLKQKYPSYSVIVTGHSLGAALATLTAMDLQNNGISGIRMFNFGSPRVGNDAFAAWGSSYLSDFSRVTHHKDMVVHSPMHERFTHVSHEWYQPSDAVDLSACTGYEDPNCSYQWHITSIDDHLNYLGLELGEGGCYNIL